MKRALSLLLCVLLIAGLLIIPTSADWDSTLQIAMTTEGPDDAGNVKVNVNFTGTDDCWAGSIGLKVIYDSTKVEPNQDEGSGNVTTKKMGVTTWYGIQVPDYMKSMTLVASVGTISYGGDTVSAVSFGAASTGPDEAINGQTITFIFKGKADATGDAVFTLATDSDDNFSISDGEKNMSRPAVGSITAKAAFPKLDPTAVDYNLPAIAAVDYDGTAKSVAAPTIKTAGVGDVTAVKYNGSTTAPSAAGTYEVTFDVAEAADYNAATDLPYGTLVINAVPVTISGVTAENKTYDGTADATVSGTASVSGVIGSDVVTVTNGTAAFADAYAGTGKTVTFSGFALGGDDAANYTLSAQPADVTADITAAAQTPTITTTASIAKGGNTLDLSAMVTDAIGDVSFSIASGDAATISGSTLTTDATKTGDVVINVAIAAKDLNSDGTNEYDAASGTITVTVIDKSDAGVTVTGDTAKTFGDAAFDLTATAADLGTGTGTWTWTSSDDAVLTVTDGKVTIVGVGTATVTAKYESDTTIGENTISITVSAKKVEKPAATGTYTYNGTEQAVAIPEGDDYTLGGDLKKTDAGDYTATATLKDTANTQWADGTTAPVSIAWSIAKKDVEIPAATGTYYYTGAEQTVAIPENDDYTLGGDLAKTDAGDYTATATLKDTANTQWSDGTIEVKNIAWTINPKKEIIVTITGDSAKTYGDPDFTLAASAAETGANESWTWTSDDTAVVTVDAAGKVTVVGAGTANITAAYDSDTVFGSAALAVTVSKATITITASSKTSYAFLEVPDISAPVEGGDYTVTGLLGTDTLGGTIVLTYEKDGAAVTPDNKTEGTYDIVPSGAVAPNANYDIKYVNGTLTVTMMAFGPSTPTATTYKVTVAETENGTVTVDNESAAAGDPIVVKIAPAEGYELDEITAGSAKLNKVSATEYTFDMPAADVTVTVTFKAAGEGPEVVNPFKDVTPDKFYYEPIMWAVKNGIAYGTTDVTFSPEIGCKRWQMVMFLWRQAGCPEPAAATENPFTDVADDVSYYKAVLWAYEKGITTGATATTFDPNGFVTREQCVALLYRMAGSNKVEVNNPFTDVSTEDYSYDAIMWACANGVTKGNNEAGTTFGPKDVCLRGEIMTFMFRAALLG